MSGLPRLRARLAREGHELLRAWPRDRDHLLLHLAPAPPVTTGAGHGRPPAWVAAQWFADDGRAAAVAGSTPDGTAGPAVHLAGTGVVVQPGGADGRLDLARRLAVPGAALLAHRPGRRAVVRQPGAADGAAQWTKVVRPGRAAGLAASASWRPPGVRVPEVLDVDEAGGAVTTGDLGGVPLHGLPPGRDDAWREAGATVAALHAAPPPDGARAHDEADELAVTLRWVEHARAHGALAPAQAGRLAAVAHEAARCLRGLAHRPAATGPLHRDLHDKQVLVGPDGVGLLDLDLVAVGDPSLDVANLLVHLHLRDLQAQAAGSDCCAGRRARAFLAGYDEARGAGHPAPRPDRVAAFARLAAARVAAVYAFRADLVLGVRGPADVGGPALGLRLVERVVGADETRLIGLS